MEENKENTTEEVKEEPVNEPEPEKETGIETESEPENKPGRSRGIHYAYSKKTRRLMGLAALVFLAVAIFAGIKIIGIFADSNEGSNYYEDIYSAAVKTTEEEETSEVPASTTAAPAETEEAETTEAATEEPTTEAVPEQEIDFDALKAINSDVIAWIEIPGTVINYPIVQGDDNEQYLRTLLDGSYHRFGTLFIDADNNQNFTDDITIIYGHHIYDGYMFADVEDYSQASFYKEHKTIWLYTPDKIYRLEPFSANILEPTYFLTLNFDSTEAYQSYLNSFRGSSYLAADIKPDANYKTVVLFTCSEAEKDKRFVLFCRLSEYVEE